LSDLKELNRTSLRSMTQELDQHQCIPWTSAEIFPGWGQGPNFAYPLQVADDAINWTFTKRFTLSTTLVCTG